MLECRKLSFSYSKKAPALKDISLAFEAGNFYGIFGPNGSGKSTLLKLLTGEIPTSAGSVFPQWKDPIERAENIALVEQQIPHDLPLSVAEVAALGNYVRLKQNSRTPGKVEEVLEEVGLSPMSSRPFNTLSGGERQRVMLARALVQDTPILCLDEPGSSLDIGFQHVLNSILRCRADRGKCVIMISHDLFSAPFYLDRMILLNKGQIVIEGEAEKVKDAPVLKRIFNLPEHFDPSSPAFFPKFH